MAGRSSKIRIEAEDQASGVLAAFAQTASESFDTVGRRAESMSDSLSRITSGAGGAGAALQALANSSGQFNTARDAVTGVAGALSQVGAEASTASGTISSMLDLLSNIKSLSVGGLYTATIAATAGFVKWGLAEGDKYTEKGKADIQKSEDERYAHLQFLKDVAKDQAGPLLSTQLRDSATAREAKNARDAANSAQVARVYDQVYGSRRGQLDTMGMSTGDKDARALEQQLLPLFHAGKLSSESLRGMVEEARKAGNEFETRTKSEKDKQTADDKAKSDAATLQSKLDGQVKDLIESVQTDKEKFARRTSEINELLERNLISEKQAELAIKAARPKVKGDGTGFLYQGGDVSGGLGNITQDAGGSRGVANDPFVQYARSAFDMAYNQREGNKIQADIKRHAEKQISILEVIAQEQKNRDILLDFGFGVGI